VRFPYLPRSEDAFAIRGILVIRPQSFFSLSNFRVVRDTFVDLVRVGGVVAQRVRYEKQHID
jgi:hypothetical protein